MKFWAQGPFKWPLYATASGRLTENQLLEFVNDSISLIEPVCCRFIFFCMDSLNNQKAVNSHHSKVVSEAHNKSISSSNQAIITNLKGNHTDLKESNFEYEDNEWDIGIGDLIIDLDADIEKSSSSNIDTSLVIPLQNPTNITAEKSFSSENNKTSSEENSDHCESNIAKQHKTKNYIKGKNETVTMSSTTNSGNKGTSKLSVDHQATLDKGLKMKIKRTKTGTKTSDSKHEIVKSEQNGNLNSDEAIPVLASKKVVNPPAGVLASPSLSANKRGSNSHRKDKGKDKVVGKEKIDGGSMMQTENNCCNCGSDKMGALSCNNPNCSKFRDLALPPRIASTTPGQIPLSLDKQTPAGVNVGNVPGAPKDSLKMLSQISGLKHKDQHKLIDYSSKSSQSNSSSTSMSYSSSTNSDDGKMSSSPPLKRMKNEGTTTATSTPATGTGTTGKGSMVDVCVGTSIGTITEPDCLGPCEPGTSVTLEGIVWHETEGGVLAVNVTWRGKTYVGTLIDCTKHDWAPPRFCDSPTEELDSRLQKGGRGKRGRNSATSTNDLINFTETRSSVHSKLRNGGSKGRASRNSSMTNINISSQTVTNTPSTSPTTFSVPRPEKRRKSKDESPSSFNGTNVQGNTLSGNNSSNNVPTTLSSLPSCAKKAKNVTSPCAISPVLLECPEQDCSKKYKHANGLKYHQSHAHGMISNADDDSSLTAPDSPSQRSQSPPPPNETNFSQKINFETSKSSSLNETKINENSMSASGTGELSNVDRPSSACIDTNQSTVHNESSSLPNTFNDTIPKPAVATNTTVSSSSTPIKQDTQNKNKTNILRFPSAPDIEQISNDSMSDAQSQSSSFYSLQNSNKAPSSNSGKSKKGRKSPGPDNESDICIINKSDGVRSPAYSDISDDSNTAAESNLNDKLKINMENNKKSQESVGGGSAPLSIGGYNNLYGPSFYQPSSFFPPPDNQSTKAQQQASSGGIDYKSKDHSPLDLMNKLQPSSKLQNDVATAASSSSNSLSTNNPVGKIMQHYQHYPYNFIQPNYPYSLDNSFGPLPSTSSSDDGSKTQGVHIKEEHGKDMSSSDTLKQITTPIPSSKLIKSENSKEMIKSESGQSMQSSLSQSPQHLSPYSSLYQRHPMGLPPLSREEEIQKYFIYPDQRRSSVGPPPPPTSQYYLPYMGPGGNPFFPDPSHPMYRNMLVPTPPYNSPYHLQMARFSSPEDLSRNPNTKALDLLQQHATQYYNSHKIHELSERVSQMKSPTSNPKIPVTSVPSPNITQPLPGSSISVTSATNNTSTSLSSNSSIMNSNNNNNNSSLGQGNLPQPPSSLNPSQQPPSSKSMDKNDRTDPKDPLSSSNGGLNRTTSPPPQRHVHTHHHTHVGIGYMSGPMYPAPYVNPAVLASQTVIPFPTNQQANK
ncbi:CLUMA_CG013305, isoform A [Clunio marinus]|uniref:CLUMA_CG013305, isoform A n=1 Tax=Clunio marinus TaxID=568069 RepID=A0A1J1ING3_9DIPT|nr:CLUMA_CG013305, isoform A [Clunio marinus]